ncbi:MAG: hypothetical protein GDA47_04030 [Rhodospirillales bacterium]|nr:hypothetical protein [Rhodospirillales bacterium]
MPLFRETPPFPKDPLYRAILGVLVFSSLASIAISLLADNRWNEPVLAEVAGYAALVSLTGYFAVRLLAQRQARRRQQPEQDNDGDA